MRKKTLYLLPMLAALTAIVFSCKKSSTGPVSSSNSNTNTNTAPFQCYVISTKTRTIKTEAIWDAQNNLQQTKSYDSTGKLFGYTNWVHSNGIPVRSEGYNANGEKVGYTDYAYADGKVISLTYYLSNNGKAEINYKEIYTYDSGKISGDSAYTYQDGKIVSTRYSKVYYNFAGNVSKLQNYNWSISKGFTPGYSTEFEYDSKKNPEYDKYNMGIFNGPNNRTRVTYLDDKGNTTNTFNYIYEYNSNGYPTKRTLISSTEVLDTWEYNCH